MKVTYRVKGLEQFVRKAKQSGGKLSKAVDKELGLSSLRVEKEAKYLAPWDTGWLSMNIYANKQSEMRYEVVSPVFYSIYVELGTRYMAAQPFLYPALNKEHWILMSRLRRIARSVGF